MPRARDHSARRRGRAARTELQASGTVAEARQTVPRGPHAPTDTESAPGRSRKVRRTSNDPPERAASAPLQAMRRSWTSATRHGVPARACSTSKRTSMRPSRPRSRRSAVAPPVQRPATRTSSGPPLADAAAARETAASVRARTVTSDWTMRLQCATRPVAGTTGPWSHCATATAASRHEVAPQPVALDPEDRLHAIGDADLPEDAREVRLHRLLADPELPRDQLVRHPVEQQPEHLALTR